MSWDSNCVDCGKAISDDYERCYPCNQEYRGELLRFDYQEVKCDFDLSWVLVMNKSEAVLPKSQCTIDEPNQKIWIPRWLAETKELL